MGDFTHDLGFMGWLRDQLCRRWDLLVKLSKEEFDLVVRMALADETFDEHVGLPHEDYLADVADRIDDWYEGWCARGAALPPGGLELTALKREKPGLRWGQLIMNLWPCIPCDGSCSDLWNAEAFLWVRKIHEFRERGSVNTE